MEFLPLLPRFSRSLRAASTACRCGVIAGVVGFLAGCATEPEPTAALETTKYTLENTDSFVLQDKVALQSISCTGLQHHALADGRIEVIANLKNRSAHKVTVQATCVFKDDQGLPNGVNLPWKTVTLPENATETVRFAASTNTATKYTVRVRDAR